MPVIEFEGKTTEEAIEKACNQLHIPSDELKFEIVSTGSSGIFGLGGKKASIRVTIEEKISSKKSEESDRNPQPVAEKRTPRYPRLRLEKGENDLASEPQPAYARRDDNQGPHFRPERKYKPTPYYHRREDEESSLPLPAILPAPGEETYEGPEDEIMTQSREILESILAHMGLEAQVTVKKIEDRVILMVQGDNGGLLIGKKGTTLDALQFLVNKIVNKNRIDKLRVIVDTENYRERRHHSLIDLAHRMADKARRSRRPVTISQLSAHDRRVVHLALQDKPGLKTRSRGDGPLKNIIIIPGSKRSYPHRPAYKSTASPSQGYSPRKPEQEISDESSNF